MNYYDLKENSVFIEPGSMNDFGGWVLDTQFIVNMGSAYLLAHGLGVVVDDAKTNIELPTPGTYKVWAYTKNWVAHWKPDMSAGTFYIGIDGDTLQEELGNNTERWEWQYAGEFSTESVQATLSLHDNNGFDGRCAGIFITTDTDIVPPSDKEELAEFRKILCKNENITAVGDFNIVVAGAGIAGICAALVAARNGLKTAIIQDRGVVGGNNSSEVRVWLGGEVNFEPYPKIGNVVNELEQQVTAHYGHTNKAHIYEDDKKLGLLKSEENITVLLNSCVVAANVENDAIKSVLIYDVLTGEYKSASAKLFADCTGDATLGAAAGADYEITTNGHMGMTNFWYVEDTGKKQSFPKCPWAIDLSERRFPGREGVGSTYDQYGELALGGWYWESGCEHDPIDMAEYARDTNFRAMYGAWDTIKNVDKDYRNYRLAHSSYIGGKRESRRLFGDIVLTKSDVYKGVKYDDACVPSTWNFDVHYPDRKFYDAFYEGDGFLTKDYHEVFNKPYFVPYRCLYSRNIDNLFMAGRNVSVSHDALGTIRVMRTGGMMGEVIGRAAKICKLHDINPRQVYQEYLDEFIELLEQ